MLLSAFYVFYIEKRLKKFIKEKRKQKNEFSKNSFFKIQIIDHNK